MRSMLTGCLAILGLLAAIGPSLACNYHDQQAAAAAQQQTADTAQGSTTSTQ